MNSLRTAALPFLGLGAALLLCACQGAGKKPAKDSSLSDVRVVRVIKVAAGEVARTVETIGTLEGEKEVRIFAQVPERIQSLAVREGEQVEAGAVLAVLRSDIQAEGVNQAQAGLEAATASRDVLKDQVRRTGAMVQAGGVPRSQLETMEIQLRAAEAQVRQISASLSMASAQRSRTVIRAPIAGQVAALNLKEGDLAVPQMPILTVVQGRRLKAVFRVPEADFLPIQEGMTVQLQALANPALSIAAKVAFKGPVVDQLTRTGRVEATVDNADGRFMAGIAVRGLVELERRPAAAIVPSHALIFTADTERTGKAVAFVVQGTTAKRRDVQIGVLQGETTEVKDGLAPGELLVVMGQHLLRDGASVKLESENVGESERKEASL